MRARLTAAADSARAERHAKVAPTKARILGVPVPTLRAIAADAFAELAAHAAPAPASEGDVDPLITFADGGIASGCLEETLVAAFVLARAAGRRAWGPDSAANIEAWRHVDGWLAHVDNWETCDQLATGVAGPLLAHATGPTAAARQADLDRWSAAKSPWQRRFALATALSLCQKGRTEPAPALRIAERLLGDEDRSVQAAVGWALREACKHDARGVLALLVRRRASMPTSVLRAAAEKLPLAERERLGVAPRHPR